MEIKKWLKAFLRTKQKYHQAFKKIASFDGNTENLHGIFEDNQVPDKKEVRKYLRKKLLVEIEKENDKRNDSEEILDPVKLVRKDRDSDRLYQLINNEKKEELSELYRELEKAEKESENNYNGTPHDKLIQRIRKELEE
ncbi:hypothetical protein [Halanaerobium sp. ST460_2HS_T2]|uniref:hypothetical protein n=1 Tax=Halanaerobium sp. ST460_2HS_T2 TaxID=2183914 RepID=UPI000DF461CE|nr:hypothetical protein [Halanaerobium sp. ST460_2HS_T2]RCW51610.1 hypothetical protein DFR80_1396 [Halanaerobium sp. ST460_2HS_T2]